MGELAAAQPGKNRRYVQLEPGPMEAELVDARLGSVQVFRERLGAGMFVEAAPPSSLLPFGIILSAGGAIRFCGRDLRPTNVAQAAGGGWDIRFAGPIDYVSCVFQRAWFEREASALLGHAPRDDWFRNVGRPASSSAIGHLRTMITRTLERMMHQPSLLAGERTRTAVEAELVRLTVGALTSAAEPTPVAAYGRRRRGVRRVIEYVTDHPDADTTAANLCGIAGVSERTLEYGFREYLDVTPVRFLKLVRLNRARRDLLRASAQASAPPTTVTDVALRWGFFELGRFAGEYRRLFGERPSETLRRP
ncbi:MAG: helix-turn-helix domain-containing protein [Deltaproteobacteria bacterium]|nr:helix-turn-helix domain-containing protein [Deltaproteobacteria bacterium]